ncbi:MULTISPECIES: hypothetical protein [unclassified Moorena]|uniref:hypothetical protein n=1 Tax=unclassified Moorena TaxID=2683338 RepID=UPI0013B7F4E9|nr:MULTISPECIES: hypothetical protein [unclassified Moorena]NEP30234.1 hypothetical protein [Moorena sp. SIO3B2]NER88374.1 hypothetical protein [Moorena sp. SIO3A2]NES40067.1 hypothetical protein [Moorena sp. SIO2C4]
MSKNTLTQEQCQELIQLLSKRKDKLDGRITKNNSLTQEQLEELVKRLSKRKNELHGRIPITAVMDSLRDLELSDLLLESDIYEVCEPMDRESKIKTWKNYFNFALILIILTAPLFTFGGYKIREFIVANFPELVGITSNNSDFNIQVNNLQNELKKLEIENDKLEKINQELNAKIENVQPLVVPSPVISPTPTVATTILTQNPAKSVKLEGIIYKFKNCQKSLNVNSSTQSISCAILITSTKENVQLRLYSNRTSSQRSRLLDQGKEYVATKVEFGTYSSNRIGYVKNSLIKDVPIEAIIDFDGVPLELNQIDILQFTSYLESSYYKGKLNTELRNLPVIPEK